MFYTSMAVQGINNVNNTQPINQQKKKHFTDKFETHIKNSTDMSDCIAVPRTIFKGYLGIMFGTTLAAGANLIKKPSKLKTGLNLAGLALSTYGTWAFARPYVLKGAVPTVKPNTNK